MCVCPAAGRQECTPPPHPFIVLPETKFSIRYIPVWARYSIGLAWCQYILVPCPYSPPPPPPSLRFLVARSIRPSPLLLSPPSPYSCHPHPHTPVTPILCTRIHASQVYEVHYGFRVVYLTYLNPQPGIRGTLRVSGAYGCEIWDILFACSNSIPPYLRTTESTSSRQPTVSATTANSAEAPPRSPAPMSTEDRSGVGGSSDGQDEQSRIVLPPETGEQPSLSSGLSDAPCLNRRRPGSPNPSSSSSSSTTTRGIRGG